MSKLSLFAEQKSKIAFFVDKITIVLGGVMMMTLAAKVQIPFWPVPMTLHTFAVMLFALLLGPRLSLGIFTAYLAAGALGAPVFSGSPERGLGLAYMMGPTGGYLAGYWIAAWLTGVMGHGQPHTLGGTARRLAACLCGLMVTYAAGLAWLSLFVPSAHLLAVGLLPFLTGDLVKCALAVLTMGLLPRRRMGR